MLAVRMQLQDLIQPKLGGEVAATDIASNDPGEPQKPVDEPTTTLEARDSPLQPAE